MKFLSLFSGIEACSQAWHPIGWKCVGVAEIEPFACEVLKRRYPGVPNLGDVSKLTEEQLNGIERPDLIVFGSPCQSFSAAGRRLGLNDPRGNLAIVALGLVAKLRPRYFIFENVPGLLSSVSGGLPDFGSLLGTIRDIGDYGCAWRVIDAQYARTRMFPHAVAQRRRRLFVVGCSGQDWRSAAAILSIPQGLQGDPAPSRKKGERTSGNAEGATGGGGLSGGGGLFDADPEPPRDINGEGEGTGSGDGSNVAVVGGVRRTVHTTMESNDVSQSLSWREYKGVSCGRDGLTSPAVVEEPIGFSIMPMNSGKDYKARETDVAQPIMTQSIGGNQGGDYVVDGAVGFQSNGNTDDIMAAGDDVSPTVRVGTTSGGGMPPAAAFKSGKIPKGITLHGSDGTTSAASVTEVSSALRSRTPGMIENSTTTAVVDKAVAFDPTQITCPENRSNPQDDDPCHTLGKSQHPPAVILSSDDASKSLKVPSSALAFKSSHYTRGKDGAPSEIAPPLSADADKGDQDTLLLHDVAVRRLTPEEAEELQGMKRGHTRIPWKGKPEEDCPDGPRYRAIGNSMAVNVMQFLGERVQMIEDIRTNTRSPYWDMTENTTGT